MANSSDIEIDSAIEEAAQAAAEATRTRLRAQAAIAAAAASKSERQGPEQGAERDITGLAAALAVSLGTLNRLRKQGLPVARYVGTKPRFDLATVRAWLDERGRKATTPKTQPDPAVATIIASAGLRRAAA